MEKPITKEEASAGWLIRQERKDQTLYKRKLLKRSLEPEED